MLTSLLDFSVICISLFAWAILTLNGYVLLRYPRKQKTQLLYIITLTLWLGTSFNAWYEGFFLFKHLSLLSSINSCTFAFLTPLFYLYYRFYATNQYPSLDKWIQHLSLPVILLITYIVMSIFNPSPEQFTYSWNNFFNYENSWWVFFCLSCYLVSVAQLCFYLCYFLGNSETTTPGLPIIKMKKEMKYIMRLYILSIATMLIPFQIAALFYYLAITILSIYLLMLTPSFRLFKQKAYLYFIPKNLLGTNKRKEKVLVKAAAQPVETPKEEPYILFSPDEETRVIEKINSPKMLYNPRLSISVLARELSTNETYLSRYFNRQLGISFPEYVSSHRLIKAEELLKETDISIIEISEQVGFQAVSTFYQAFNAKYKITPLQWRKKHTKPS